jgi:predicted negative regulator of RcsB-dependent stress response
MQEKRRCSKRIDIAYELNSNRKLKSRIAYLRGQVLENLGQNDKARESYSGL